MSRYNVAIVGASGVVGKEIISILEGRKFPFKMLSLFGSDRSAGSVLNYNNKEYKVELLKEDSLKNYNFCFFAASEEVSEKYIPIAAGNGAYCIDKSSFFRMNENVPLVVPEVNGEDLDKCHTIKTIASPNCTTIQLVQVLKPLDDFADIKRVVINSYQAVSGAGQEGVDELAMQMKAIHSDLPVKVSKFSKQIAFNCLPMIGRVNEAGYTSEETKVIEETRKILHKKGLAITCTAVRVPVYNAHSEAVNIEFNNKFELKELIKKLQDNRDLEVIEDPNNFPDSLTASGKDKTFVGRIRRDNSVENGVNLWIVSDNLRKGAALNAVQIAENLVLKLDAKA